MNHWQAVLHLLSNYRWTERAEPAANLAIAERACGAGVLFACGSPPGSHPNRVAMELEARGFTPHVLELPKHFSIGALRRDAPCLRELLNTAGIGIAHAHMLNAHVTAAVARRGLPGVRIVRTSYEPEGLPRGLREYTLAARATDGLIVTTEDARETLARRYPKLRERIALIEPGIDLERFSPDRSLHLAEPAISLPEDAFVVGIVSRLRKDRRIDIVIDAVAALARDCPRLHLLIVGRGGPAELDEAVTQPITRAGCADRVHMAGYKRGDDLVAAYRRMNVLAYPAPGTDKSCRTIREAMAAGVTVIGARVGYVPHLVEHEVTGLLAEQSASSFSDAIRRVYEDTVFLEHLRAASLARARERFSLETQAKRTLAFYDSIV